MAELVASKGSPNPSPMDKRRMVRESFARKVCELEMMAASPDRATYYPKTLAEFAAWRDDAKGLSPWTKPGIVTSPEYADLRRRRDAAVKVLALSTDVTVAKCGDARERAMEAQVRILATQLLRERAESRSAQRLLLQVQVDYETLETRFKELLAERQKVVSIVKSGPRG